MQRPDLHRRKPASRAVGGRSTLGKGCVDEAALSERVRTRVEVAKGGVKSAFGPLPTSDTSAILSW